MQIYVDAVGLWAPGLPGWTCGQTLLRGDGRYRDQDLAPLAPPSLPRNESRRIGFATRLALQVAHEALSDLPLPAANLATVFACSGGNPEALDTLCSTLHRPGRPLSPNQFINSVHNASLGYWTIATGCRGPAVSLAAYDASFAAGLLEAGTLAVVEQNPVLMVAFDVPPPPSLLPFRPIHRPFAVALALAPERTRSSLARWRLRIRAGAIANAMNDTGLEKLRTGNPAARCLPLLESLAQGQIRRLNLPYLDKTQLWIDHTPC